MRTIAAMAIAFALGVGSTWVLAQRHFGAFTQFNLHTDVLVYQSLLAHAKEENLGVVQNWLVLSLCNSIGTLRDNQGEWFMPRDEAVDRTIENAKILKDECSQLPNPLNYSPIDRN